MPRRSNTFQKLVTLLETALASNGVLVRESVLLKDLRTGEEREVDIILEGMVSSYKTTIGIEVIDRSRPASTPWVEAMYQKHADLPIDKTILVSRSGFYAPASEKARLLKMDPISFDDAGKADWISKVDAVAEVTLDHFRLPVLDEIVLVFPESAAFTLGTLGDIEELEIVGGAGKNFGSVRDFVATLLGSPDFLDKTRDIAVTDADTAIEGDYSFGHGTHVRNKVGLTTPICRVKFRAVCKRKIEKVVPISGRYGNVVKCKPFPWSLVELVGDTIALGLGEVLDARGPCSRGTRCPCRR